MRVVLGPRVRDEFLLRVVFGAPDANAAAAAGVVAVPLLAFSGFGIADVQHIVLFDEDPARPAELLPLGDETAVLFEDLDAVVLAVSHVKPSPGIEGHQSRPVAFREA